MPALLPALAALLLTAAPIAAASPPPLDSLHLESRRITSAKGIVIEAQEGWLGVPERRGVAASRRIPIRFVRLKSPTRPDGPALFYLAGGPGDTGTGAVRDPRSLDLWAAFLAAGDVVLIDQRGTRDPLLRWDWDGPVPADFFVNADTARAHAMRVARRGAQAIRERRVDLAGYTTLESVADLEELRVALRLPRISLLGFSYGTHLGCAYLREHGEHVANAILVGNEGPSHTYKLPSAAETQWARLSRLAAADPAIGRDVPDLGALLDRVLARLARQPMTVPLEHPVTKQRIPVAVGPFGLLFVLRADLGDATDLPVFPRLLWSIEHGDSSALAWFVAKRAGIALAARGMSAATDAASHASAGRLALIASEAPTSRFADVVNFPFPETAPVWSPHPLPDTFRAPLVSDVRTLFLSGELDWNSPPYQAEEIRWGFTQSTHLVVRNAGHEQTLWQNPGAVPLLVDFLLGKDVSTRRIDLPPMRFVPLTGRHPSPSHPSVE